MTIVAPDGRSVEFDLITSGDDLVVRLRKREVNVARGIWNGSTQDRSEQKDASMNGRGVVWIGVGSKKSWLGEEPPAQLRIQLHLFKLWTKVPRKIVERRQIFVDERIGGGEEGGQTFTLSDHDVLNEHLSFLNESAFQIWAMRGKGVRVLGEILVLTELQPLSMKIEYSRCKSRIGRPSSRLRNPAFSRF